MYEEIKKLWNEIYEDKLSLFEFLDKLVFYLKKKKGRDFTVEEEFKIRVCACRIWSEKFGYPFAIKQK